MNDEFGGTPVQEDEFGGILTEEETPRPTTSGQPFTLPEFSAPTVNQNVVSTATSDIPSKLKPIRYELTAPPEMSDEQIEKAFKKPPLWAPETFVRGLSQPSGMAFLGATLPALSDEQRKDLLLKEYNRRSQEGEPSGFAQGAETVGGIVGSLVPYAIGAKGGRAGMAAAGATMGLAQSFLDAGTRAIAEGKTPEEALVIADAAAKSGAVIGGGTATVLPTKSPTSFKGAAKTGLISGPIFGAGTTLENAIKQYLGLDVPLKEGVVGSTLTGGLLPVVAHGVAKGLKLVLPEIPLDRTTSGSTVPAVEQTAPIPEQLPAQPRQTTAQPEQTAPIPEQPKPAETAAAPESAPAPSLKPAVLIKGEPVVGKVGETHDQIKERVKASDPEDAKGLFEAAVMADAEKDHVFVDENGKVLNRRDAAEKFDKLMGNKPGTTLRLHSQDLDRLPVPEVAKPAEPAPVAEAPKVAEQTKPIAKYAGKQYGKDVWEVPGGRGPSHVSAETARARGFEPEEVPVVKESLTTPLEPKPAAGAAEPTPEISNAESLVRDKILNAPSFPKLLAASKSFQKSLGRILREDWDEWKKQTPWDLLSEHAGVMNAKSARSKTLRSLADSVIQEAQLPMKEPGKYRGLEYRVDWNKIQQQPTAPPEPTPAPAAKEPWQMTKEEWRADRDAKMERAASLNAGNPKAVSDALLAVQREPLHPDIVGQALREGKPVPPEVLADYPDLKAAAKEPVVAKSATVEPAKPEAPKWTSATREDAGLGTQMSAGIPDPIATFKSAVSLAKYSMKVLGPKISRAIEAVKELGQEEMNASRMTDYRRAVLHWSAKLQRSFGEAADAQSDIQKRVPDPVKREGITNWREAGGDAKVLAQWAAQTQDPKLKAGYEAALKLTPDELAVAQEVKTAFDTLGQRGQAHDVVSNFRDNYVTHIWDTGKGPAMGSSRTLKDKFRYNKARTFDTFFDGEQEGYSPKTKDISKILPVYLHEMNSVIAARQLVAQMSKGTASDGRRLVLPRGIGVPVEGEKGAATLVFPDVSKVDTGDYRTMTGQPALTDWKYLTRDPAGNPVMLKADLAIHPEAFARIKAVLGKSAIREWYNTRTSALAQIPKNIVKGLDRANSEAKRTAMGLLAPFHQVQEGWHGVGHRVNPTFNIPKIDLVNNAAQMDAARHGLMILPDRVSEGQFMEGFRTSGLVSKLPGIGKAADFYSNYLFHEYIPGLKFKTYSAILDRNLKVYAKELASGSMKAEDVKVLSGEQANAAFGHLNYADMARNPTLQHIMQLGLLAPDFLEARARFTGQGIKGLTGAKVGREQILALITLALAQAALAYTSAKVTGGEWDKKRPFEFTKDNRRYTLRSVPEDVSSLLRDTRMFAHSRLSPILGKGTLQYLSGVDWRGQKVTAGQTTKELLQQPIPLTAKGFLGVGNSPLSSWEQLAGAVGLKISRYSSANDIFEMVKDWAKNNDDARVQAAAEQQEKETFASKYEGLHKAVSAGSAGGVQSEMEKLQKSMPMSKIIDYMKTYSERPFTGSADREKQFLRSLSESDRALYWQAREQRQGELRKFYQMLP